MRAHICNAISEMYMYVVRALTWEANKKKVAWSKCDLSSAALLIMAFITLTISPYQHHSRSNTTCKPAKPLKHASRANRSPLKRRTAMPTDLPSTNPAATMRHKRSQSRPASESGLPFPLCTSLNNNDNKNIIIINSITVRRRSSRFRLSKAMHAMRLG